MNYNQFLEKLESTAEGREYLDIVERAKSRSRKKQKLYEN